MVLLLTLTLSTFLWKQDVYGATPFFNAAKLFFEERLIYAGFALWHFSAQAARVVLPSVSSKEDALARAIPVLTYHRLELTGEGGNVTFFNFMDQMETLYAHGWRTITLSDYQAFMRGEKSLPEKSFLITFDDGAQQSFYPTDPVFRVLGFTAVQYVIVAGSETKESVYYLSPEQIRHMLKNGRWEIGSHSYDAHRPYTTDAQGSGGTFYADKLWLPEEERLETDEEFRTRVSNDLRLSKEALEAAYGVPIRTFAFPFGGESGVETARNFPEGEEITVEEASKWYELGWVQTERKEYTLNYPAFPSFLQLRIHVEYDWDGEELLRVMENSLPKSLPFVDDMAEDQGWLASWGEVHTGDGLLLKAKPKESGASTLLDGSRLWHTYAMEATVEWSHGYAFLLGSASAAHTYRSCVFGAGEVQLQDTRERETTVLTKRADPNIQYGNEVRLGMRVESDHITCLYNGENVLTVSGVAASQGGVGVQTWSSVLGQAELAVRHLFVEEL